MEDLLFRLKKYFEKRDDVTFAFLFGSAAGGHTTPISDVDIAVYFCPEKRTPLEYEKRIYYKDEDRVWADMERIVGKEVDLLVLNRSPATIASSVIRGVPIIIKDFGLYLDFMEIIISEAIDFRELLKEDFIDRYERRV